MATTIDTLAIKIIADATDVTSGIGKVTKEVREAARIVSSLESPLDKVANKERRLNQLFDEGAISQRNYSESMKMVRSKMDELAAAKNPAGMNFGNVASQIPVFGQIYTGVTSAAGAVNLLGTAFREMGQLAHAAVDFVVDSGKRIDDVADQAERLGMTVGGLSELKIAANFADVKDFGSVDKGLEKMLVNVSKAAGGIDDMDLETKKAAASFNILGLSANELIGLSPDQMFARISEELAEIPTNAQRAEIIKDIFGKGGNELKNLIEHLEEYKQQAIDSGAVVTDFQAAEIAKADAAMKRLMTSAEGLGNVLATSLAPTLATVADSLATIAKNPGIGANIISAFAPGPAGIGTTMSANIAATMMANQMAARAEKEQRESAAPSDAQKEINLAKVEAAEAKSAAAEAKKAATSESAVAKEFDQTSMALEREITILRSGKEAWAELDESLKGFNDEQREQLSLLRDEKAVLEAVAHAKEQDLKLEKERVNEAEKIRESLRSDKEVARDRVSGAMDLVTTGELDPGDADKLVRREAERLVKPQQERNLKAVSFGSQEAIAAIANRGAAREDSQRLDEMIEWLKKIAEKEAVEVEEVSLQAG